MSVKKRGERSFVYDGYISVYESAAVGGRMESAGKFARYFDYSLPDALWGETSFEKTEKKMFKYVVDRVLSKAGCKKDDVDVLIGGDLLNQIVSSGYAARDLELAFLGVYGACSTMSQSLLMGGMLVDGGFCDRVICATCSHFAAAERQFRYPLELGTPKTPVSQNTATAAGAIMLVNGKFEGRPNLVSCTVGRAIDGNITDANNMGAAMAPAAAETILTHLQDMCLACDHYDLIVTGDLGTFGSELLLEMCEKCALDISNIHFDCGAQMYEGMCNINCGASGCGCGASVLSGYILQRLKDRELKRVLFVATGALLSPTVVQQGESIPSIAHAVSIELL